ncbi:MAG: metallophosphoesterase [bacterium]|nr:metallophosphoesterase [bacterium]
MKIAVLSDTHDNLAKFSQALQAADRAGAQAIIHAGDFVAPFTLEPLREVGMPIHAVLGNNDGEVDGLRRRFAILGAHFWEGPVAFYLDSLYVSLQHKPYNEADLNGFVVPPLPPHVKQSRIPDRDKLSAIEGGSASVDDPASQLLSPPALFIFGHTHQLKIEKRANLTLLNPGECCGLLTGRATMIIYDTCNGVAEVVELN